MTTEQAQKRLEEICRLLAERKKASKIVHDIDTQIDILAGAATKPHALKSQKISRDDFIAIVAGGSQ